MQPSSSTHLPENIKENLVKKNLPYPDPQAWEHSKKLSAVIRAEILSKGGAIPFSRYMDMALYQPGLGYYSAGSEKVGKSGDFVTAPEISPLFAECIAQQCSQVLECLSEKVVLEFGAGSGKMAAQLLLALEKKQQIPDKYFILEISADFRQRQKETLQSLCPHLISYVHWLDRLPENKFSGIILANEVLDAMPVEIFGLSKKGAEQFFVKLENEEFAWQLKKLSDPILKAAIESLSIDTAENYVSEINSFIPGWIASISDCLEKGLVLLIDYGFSRKEYYHPDRSMGTLMCHYRQRSHTDPLILTGLQDITAHVDFTAVAEAAVENNFKVAGFTNQAAFLLACDLLDLGKDLEEQKKISALQLSQQIQILTSPNEMGELFKVLALTRGLETLSLRGFRLLDQRFRL